MTGKRLIKLIIAAVIGAVLLSACTQETGQIESLSQLKEKGTVIAIATNTPEAEKVLKDFPDAKVESYTDIFPAYQEVASGKIAAVIYQRTQMQKAIDNGAGL